MIEIKDLNLKLISCIHLTLVEKKMEIYNFFSYSLKATSVFCIKLKIAYIPLSIKNLYFINEIFKWNNFDLGIRRDEQKYLKTR